MPTTAPARPASGDVNTMRRSRGAGVLQDAQRTFTLGVEIEEKLVPAQAAGSEPYFLAAAANKSPHARPTPQFVPVEPGKLV
jgi:hypothetical protein